MKSIEFNSFEEAKKYAKSNPGSSIVRQVKYIVKHQKKTTEKQVDSIEVNSEEKPQKNQQNKSGRHSNNIFKLESYPMVRLLNRSWRGNIENIIAIRQDNQEHGRFLNSGMPFTVEEIELFDKWIKQGKTEDEFRNFFQRNITDIPKLVKKNQERIARGYRERYWDNGGLCSKHGWLNCDICNTDNIDNNDKETDLNEPISKTEILNPEAFSKSLNELKTLIYKSLNLEEILAYGNDYLPNLEISAIKSMDYSEADKTLIFDLSNKLKAIKMFSEEFEDIKYMQYKEEFEESIGKFYEIIETLGRLEIIKVIQKEIRELIAKKDSAISSSSAKKAKALSAAISKLNENRPICIKCNNKMVLREGNSSYFWGCSIFPDCWRTKWLNKKELQILGKK
tara:strand:- start:112 stop:1296 length:1185 start_codon:yes stop_codon:yes gene_type:complete